MANILDIILDWKNVTKKNENISFLYIVYQMSLFVSTLLTPGTVFMIILGAIIVGFEAIPPYVSLLLNLFPVGLFLLMTLYASSQRQVCFIIRYKRYGMSANGTTFHPHHNLQSVYSEF